MEYTLIFVVFVWMEVDLNRGREAWESHKEAHNQIINC